MLLYILMCQQMDTGAPTGSQRDSGGVQNKPHSEYFLADCGHLAGMVIVKYFTYVITLCEVAGNVVGAKMVSNLRIVPSTVCNDRGNYIHINPERVYNANMSSHMLNFPL